MYCCIRLTNELGNLSFGNELAGEGQDTVFFLFVERGCTAYYFTLNVVIKMIKIVEDSATDYSG